MNIRFSNLQQVALPAIHNAFNDAFSNYQVPFQLSFQQLRYMLERRGCDLKYSYGAFDGDFLVGFILNGMGSWNELQTAYDTGTGLRPAYQGQGIAKQLFDFAVADLKKHGVQQYLLEVIQTNTAAFSLYQKKGFEITRELDFYVFPKTQLDGFSLPQNENIIIRQIKNPDWSVLRSFWGFQPTWQNSIASIQRKQNKFCFLGGYEGEKLIGYVIVEMHTGDIPQLAVHPMFRRKGIGSMLLESVRDYVEGDQIRLINLERGCTSMEGLVDKIGLGDSLGQYEMVMSLG